jgi:MFS family permease
MKPSTSIPSRSIFNLAVVVAALGYFVDIYDLLLFTIVREPSLQGLGVDLTNAPAVISASTKIINWQMVGLLIGGILWGVMGDKRGRLSVLFGSILLYSVANFVTGFVTTIDQYAWARFVAGVGLAGELGAGITLVSELLPKEKRGLGTSMVAGVGLFGAVFAYFTYDVTQGLAAMLQDWWWPGHWLAAVTDRCGRKRHVSPGKGNGHQPRQCVYVFYKGRAVCGSTCWPSSLDCPPGMSSAIS